MSTTDGDAASRLEAAIAGVFDHPTDRRTDEGDDRSNGAPIPAPTTDDDWSIDGPDDDEPFTMPEIVPATPPTARTDDRVPGPTIEPTLKPGVPAPATPPTAPTARTAPAPTAPARVPQQQASAPATSWADHMVPLQSSPATNALRTPGRRPRVRRVTRVVRHIDPWSTFKLALLFSVVAYLVTLTAGVLLWRVADSTGTLDNVERWFTQFGWETFEFNGGEIFHNAWIIGLFGAVGLTGGLVLLATLFNLVSDIVGGIRVTVLEEEVVERTVSSTRRYVVRRPPVGAESGAWDVDSADDADDAVSSESTSASTSDDTEAVPVTDWSIDDDESDEHDARSGAPAGAGESDALTGETRRPAG